MSFSDQDCRPFWVMFGIHPSPSGFGPPANRCDETIPPRTLRGLPGIGRKRLVVEEEQFPAADEPANIEWKPDAVIAYPARYWRQRLDIGEQVAEILHLGSLIGAIWECGK